MLPEQTSLMNDPRVLGAVVAALNRHGFNRHLGVI